MICEKVVKSGTFWKSSEKEETIMSRFGKWHYGQNGRSGLSEWGGWKG